jgi:hypothetical protein
LICGAPTNRPDRRRLDARGRYEPVAGPVFTIEGRYLPPRIHCCENHHTPDKPGPTQNQQSHGPITTQRLDTRTTVDLSCAKTRHSCGGLVFRWYPPSAPDHGARVLLTWEGHLSVGRLRAGRLGPALHGCGRSGADPGRGHARQSPPDSQQAAPVSEKRHPGFSAPPVAEKKRRALPIMPSAQDGAPNGSKQLQNHPDHYQNDPERNQNVSRKQVSNHQQDDT